MTQEHRAISPGQPRPKAGIVGRLVGGLFKYVMPLVVIVVGILVAKHLIATAPKAQRRPPARQTTLVNIYRPERMSTTAEIRVMGTVVPSREVSLMPRVSGEVVELNPKFVPGGQFAEGEFILKIDPEDYKLAIERADSEIVQAQYEMKLEQGHQEIAKREWELLDMDGQASELDQELALRRPHLLRAQARLKAAQAAKREAELALERTTISAPFPCIVASENTDLGTQVSPQTQLGRLVGTETYWVQAAVPVDQLRWIRFPNEQGQEGSTAVIYQELGPGVQSQWPGQVVRLLSDLEPQGRMARVLISVPDPLGIQDDVDHPVPLLIDAYVNVLIQGHPIDNIIALPRQALREDGRVWVMDDNDELVIRTVDILRSNRDRILVRAGIEEADRIIISDLPAPVEGMALAEMDGNTSSSPPKDFVVQTDESADSQGGTP